MSDTENTLTTVPPTNSLTEGSNLLPPASSHLEPSTAPRPPVKSLIRRLQGRRRFNPKPPKDSKIRKAVVAAIALKAQGFKWDEIAEQLHLTKQTIQTYVKRANQVGWINLDSFNDPDDQLEHVIKSKVTKNLNAVLTEVNADGELTNRAVDVTLEVAKGTGLLKQHQVVKSDQTSTVGVALKVQVDMPPSLSGAAPTIRSGSIGGQPAFDAEIIESKEE